MWYKYHFYTSGNREDIGATVSTDAPIPYIQVGHTLQLELPALSTKAGYYWEIRAVEVYLFQPPQSDVAKIEIHVILREQARSPER